MSCPNTSITSINGAGREYFYFQRGRGGGLPGPRVRLPGGPHKPEFWAAYQSCLGGDTLTGKAFDDLIKAYRISPEFNNRSEATKRDYVRYLDTISTAWPTPSRELQAEACHPSARQVGEYASRSEYARRSAKTADCLGHPARILGE